MKAIAYTKCGPPEVLGLHDVERPTPGNNQVLIRIYATTVTPTDVSLRRGKLRLLSWTLPRLTGGIANPRFIPGYELAGEIAAAGKDVTRFKTGDHVFGATGWRMSCNAEYVCVPETCALATKPANVTFEEAAALVDGTCTALHFLRKGNVHAGQKVLIYGASGSVGTSAVQLARHLGAIVTGVCSTTNTELVKSLGAATIIDYTKEDFSTNGETYDVIFHTTGRCSFTHCMGSLTPEGIFLSTVMKLPARLRGKWTSMTGGKKVIGGISMSNAADLRFLNGLIEAGEIKPVIDRRFPLEHVAAAHRYVELGHKKGNVIVTLQ